MISCRSQVASTVMLWVLVAPSALSQATAKSASEVPSGQVLQDVSHKISIGEYRSALRRLNNLFNREDLDPEQLEKAYLYAARLEFAFSRPPQARYWLTRLVQLNPEAKLDPLNDPPEVIDLWYQVLNEHQNRIKRQSKASETLGQASKSPWGSQAEPSGDLWRKRVRTWMGLAPLGIGHFQAGDYQSGFTHLVSQGLAIYARPFFEGKENIKIDPMLSARTSRVPTALAIVSFMSLWGYQVLDLVPSLSIQDSQTTESARNAMNLGPFGLGQAKNGQEAKAWGIGGIQAALLFYSLAVPNDSQRRTAMTLWAGVYTYGVIDAWLYHRPLQVPIKQTKEESQSFSSFSISLIPPLAAEGYALHDSQLGTQWGGQLQWLYRLP